MKPPSSHDFPGRLQLTMGNEQVITTYREERHRYGPTSDGDSKAMLDLSAQNTDDRSINLFKARVHDRTET
jgi:hypothetical protein